MDSSRDSTGRWGIVIAGALLQMCLGTVYAWSFFQKPLVETFHWSNTQVAWVFSLAICSLGLAAAVGGKILPVTGPRRLAVLGGSLFGAGYLLAAVAMRLKSLPLLYVGYGVVGGIGLGLGYVTPVATVARWFPDRKDRKGLATGIVIMGFGLGALLMSKFLAPFLVRVTGNDYVLIFAGLGIFFAVATTWAGWYMRFPAAVPRATVAAQRTGDGPSAGACLVSPRFLLMWVVFFCNILVGILIIAFQSPLLQNLWKQADPATSATNLAAYGATLIAVTSLFNGLGRMLWGAFSDRIGRRRTFQVMLATQAFVFVWLLQTRNPWLFAVLACYVLLCYGGGFGTMPAFVLDVFGSRRMPVVYGTMLTAWSAAGVVGPQLLARLTDRFHAAAAPFAFAANCAVLAVGLALTLFLGDHPLHAETEN